MWIVFVCMFGGGGCVYPGKLCLQCMWMCMMSCYGVGIVFAPEMAQGLLECGCVRANR